MEQQANTVISTEVVTVSNVIIFPKKRLFDDPPMNLEEAQNQMFEARSYLADEVAEDAMETVMSVLRNYNIFTKTHKTNMKDIVALSEVIKASILRYYDIEHPMQSVIDRAITLSSDDDFDETDESVQEIIIDSEIFENDKKE